MHRLATHLFRFIFIPKPSKGEIGMDAMVIFSFSSHFLPHSFVIYKHLNNPLFEWSFKAEFGKRLLKTFLFSL